MNPVFIDHEGRLLSTDTQAPPLPEVEIPEMERITRLAQAEASKQSTKK